MALLGGWGKVRAPNSGGNPFVTGTRRVLPPFPTRSVANQGSAYTTIGMASENEHMQE